MNGYRLIADATVELDVEAAFDWYENEQPGLGYDFLDELRAGYVRIAEGRSSTSSCAQEFGAHCYVASHMQFTSR